MMLFRRGTRSREHAVVSVLSSWNMGELFRWRPASEGWRNRNQ